MLRSRVLRVATTTLLGLSLISGLGCRRTTTPDGQEPKGETEAEVAKQIALPDPLPLPEHPALGTWLAQPSEALAMVQAYSPAPIEVAPLAQQALSRLTTPELAEAIATGLDLGQPFANVVLDDGQEVLRVGLSAAAREQLGSRFAALEPAGEFGGVHLPPAPASQDARPWLAWIDADDRGSFLVLANSEAGLVTGRALATTYGKDPVFFSVDPGELALPVEVPVARAEGRGSLGALTIDVEMLPGQDPLAGQPIAAGTLAGLLTGPDISVGISSTYADYDATVRQITSEVNAQVRELPFLIKSIGEDLAASLNTLLRTWDGRTLVALGPANHVRIAYGANDVAKSQVATIRLLQKVIDNASLARNFTSAVPKMALRRRVAKGGGVDIEMFVLSGAASFMPPEARALIDGEGRLNLAMAWSKTAGGGLLVIGPQADRALARWLDETADAPAHTETRDQLVSAVFAADPAMLASLLMSGGQPDPNAMLGIEPGGPRWQVDVTPAGPDRYTIELDTPGAPKPPRAM